MAATDGIYALLIIRGKNMNLSEVGDRVERQQRFFRLAEAFYVARHYGFINSTLLFEEALYSMGGTLDEDGRWHDAAGRDELPTPGEGADMSAGWEV
jgi:hypothetical protein